MIPGANAIEIDTRHRRSSRGELVEPTVASPRPKSSLSASGGPPRERIPPREDPQFHLKLGRGSLSDIEWTAQLLQLRHGVSATGTMTALDALSAQGAMAADDAD